jgi:hypothetical protein
VTSAASAPIGVRHAAHPHQQHVRAGQGDQRDRISTTCHSSIWPKFITLKNADPGGAQRVLDAGRDPLRVAGISLSERLTIRVMRLGPCWLRGTRITAGTAVDCVTPRARVLSLRLAPVTPEVMSLFMR